MASVDPTVPNWADLPLPDAWPDSLNFKRPHDWWRLMLHVLGRDQQPVKLPAGLPYAERIPKYILQEFHNLPNGNYSRRFTRGYITGFNKVMLGEIRKSHALMAEQLAAIPAIKQGSVLDVGCGGGGLAGALQAEGIADVWGLDPSPYLLKHAAHDWPAVRFVQGVAENTEFSANRFDAITACYLLHEIPPRYLTRCFEEWARILKPGGWLSFCEPSPLQWQENILALWRQFGWRGIYFHLLAHKLNEPFIAAWHRQNLPELLHKHGFVLEQEQLGVPMRHVLARKR